MGKKRRGGVHFQISTVLKGKKSVVHSFSPSVRWGERVGGGYTFEETIVVEEIH